MYSELVGTQAYANMRVLMLKHRNGFKNKCHRTCQNAWHLPVMYPSAIAAWNAIPATAKNKDPKLAPIGVPHFWTAPGDPYGHVALQSAKRGIVISTDAPITDYVGEVPLTWFTSHWGKSYLGWASVYNGVKLHTDGMPR